MKFQILVAFALSLGLNSEALTYSDQEPPVKMSTSGICHPKGGTFYSRTKNYRPFQSMKACLEAGGRRPKS
ncbi:MAG: hypothetical protein AAFR64_08495 [Pseudomonadota bacterium]